MRKTCYECDKVLQDSDVNKNVNVVQYPAKKIVESGEMVYDNPIVTIYLCEGCFDENKKDVIHIYE